MDVEVKQFEQVRFMRPLCLWSVVTLAQRRSSWTQVWKHFDRDLSGEIDYGEFYAALTMHAQGRQALDETPNLRRRSCLPAYLLLPASFDQAASAALALL